MTTKAEKAARAAEDEAFQRSKAILEAEANQPPFDPRVEAAYRRGYELGYSSGYQAAVEVLMDQAPSGVTLCD